jgi:DNA-binding winged helix-turn-helix (wHTH) protein
MKPVALNTTLTVEAIAHKTRGDQRSPLVSRHGSLAFGPFRLDLGSCRLFREGVEVALRPQVFRVLAVLVQAAGEPVDYKRMSMEAWSGAPVSRHAVAVTVVEARKALLEYGSWIRYRRRFGFCLEIPKTEPQASGAEIQAFEQRLAEALRSNDVDRIRAAYAPDKVPFAFPKPVQPEWERWGFSTEGNLGYAHGTFHTTASAEHVPMRVTHILRKINGDWMIVHEHVSFPVLARDMN